MKILFIAYYFRPFEGVGAKRITYWAENIKKDQGISKVTVLTATSKANLEGSKQIDEVIYIPPVEKSFFGSLFAFDKGALWYPSLKKYVVENIKKNDFDYVVITGNPFLHFFILKLLKKLDVKLVIDFRDPMAVNPRSHKPKGIKQHTKKQLLKALEKYFIGLSDVCITVNKHCANLLVGFSKYSHKIKTIDNGYDESFLALLKTKEPNFLGKELVYSGSLYKDRSCTNLIKAIQELGKYTFHHIGSPLKELENEEQVVSHGLMPYEDNLELINDLDIALIFTAGYEFESTTKIFDYIGLEKIILIVTEGPVKKGALADITEDYPYIYWAKNDVYSICTALKAIKNDINRDVTVKYTNERHSREYGLKKFIELLKAHKPTL